MKGVRLFVVMISAWLTACATEIKVTDPRTGIEYIVPGKYRDIPGIQELSKLCAETSGEVIHQVANADGYFDKHKETCEMSCWDQIAFSPFQYLEIKVQDPNAYDFIKEPGIWKIYKTSIDNPKCNQEIKGFMQTRKIYKNFSNKECLAIKKMSEPESEFSRSYIGKTIGLNNELSSEIFKQTQVIKNLHTDEVIANQIYFSLYPKHSKLNPGLGIGCASIGIKKTKGTFLIDVLKTKEGK